jgi:hypothetical protein
VSNVANALRLQKENMNILLTLFGIEWAPIFAQLANLFVIIFLIALPFIIWTKYKKKEAIRNEQLNRIEDGIVELKARGTNITNSKNEA